MNDIDRNARTLVVCFVIAAFSLTLLRFVEIGNVTISSSTQVLGATNQTKEEIILPNADLDKSTAKELFN